MAKKYSLLIVLIITAVFANAQEKLTNNIYQKILPNGLTILVIEDHSVPLTTVLMTFKAGSFAESDDINGLTGLYESMLQKGNRDHNDQQDLNYYAGQLGMMLRNSTASYEYASSYFTLPASNFEKGLLFMNSSIRFPKMNADELEKEKAIVNSQLNDRATNANIILSDSIDHCLWGNLSSRKNPVGTHKAITSATPATLNLIRNRYFYPNNALMIVAGDLNHATAFATIEKIYGDWARSAFDPLKKWPTPEFAPLTKSSYVIAESELSKVPLIAIYWQGPDTRHDIASTYSADVFSYLINQNASKLSKALIQSGLATNMGINYLTCKFTGPISLIIRPAPGKIKECMDEVKKQIDMMDSDDYLSEGQIETAKRILEIRKVREEEITTDYVHTISFWWTSASINYFLGYNANLEKVTRDDIKAYVRKYIKNKPYVAGLLINHDLRVQTNADNFFKQ